MSHCYYCGCELNETNRSLEHIIPNALYGKLKSKDILCKKCNNGLSKVDCALSDSFMLFINLLDGKADRLSKKDMTVEINGEKATLKPNMEFHSDKFLIDDRGNGAVMFKTFFSQGNEKSRQCFLKLIQKYLKNEYGRDYSLEEIERDIETQNEPVVIQTSLGKHVGKPLDLGIIILGYLKISLGFCALKSKIQDVQKEVLDTFRNHENFKIEEFIKFVRLPDDKFIDGRLCHHIYLIGDSFNSKMFCIISLFNCLNVAIILNEEYNGDDFQESYVFDVICNREICKTMNFDFDEISEKQFDINRIMENQTNTKVLDFFIHLSVYLKNIQDKLIQLYDYTNLKNMDMMSKEEFINFVQTSFDKAAEKRLLVLNKYFIFELTNADFQDILYYDYKQRISVIKQFFESDDYRQALDYIQNVLPISMSKDQAKEFFLHSISNIWLRILG